jgi:hypothetical protein
MSNIVKNANLIVSVKYKIHVIHALMDTRFLKENVFSVRKLLGFMEHAQVVVLDKQGLYWHAQIVQ